MDCQREYTPYTRDRVQFPAMSTKRKSLWGPVVIALLSGLYEGLAFLGLPPYSNKTIAKVTAFLVFAGAMLRMIYKLNKEVESYRNPEFDLAVEPTFKLQKDPNGWHAGYWRLAIKT